ncbi:reticuline oxidase-like protein-like [Dorcoceras hygrometricum]|uniref:Reticuline oxidase-like protein-like n=1 Tax=Dorcoceras hygrometricum TaxID=472368 RepID=A0A2Z7AA35_9LAMI|nr:reticuline oxidase-like protein-like [Dorcoceras hygrometricum]
MVNAENVVVLYSDYANLDAGRNYLLDGQTSFDQQRIQQLAIHDQQMKKDRLILSRSSVQATNHQVRDLGRIRAIELLPDFVQTAGFVLPDFTRYSCFQTSGFAQFT